MKFIAPAPMFSTQCALGDVVEVKMRSALQTYGFRSG